MLKKKIITILIFAIGVIILLYPIVTKIISYNNQTIAISKYIKKVDNINKDEKEKYIEQTENYNKGIYEEDIFNTEEEKIDSIDFLKENEVIAYINIPKIDINLPIYEGTSDKILNMGVGHIKNTSYPSESKNTHCVLVGHTGLAHAKIFDDLDKLEIGDIFYINYLGENFKYKVTEINTILPEDTKKLEIEENKNKVTLVTCTPKHINTHRLLVTGEKEEIKKDEINLINDKITSYQSKINVKILKNIIYIIISVLILIISIIIIGFIFLKINSLIKHIIKKHFKR